LPIKQIFTDDVDIYVLLTTQNRSLSRMIHVLEFSTVTAVTCPSHSTASRVRRLSRMSAYSLCFHIQGTTACIEYAEFPLTM
jgi:hypothetical protein